MSYAITVYFNNECIDNTYIYTEYFTHRGYYGDSAYSTSGLTFNSRFTANPADGCVFSHWVYRYVVNGVQSDAMESTENPFYYDGSEGDLIIRAVGEEEYVEPEDPTWTLSTDTIGSISDSHNEYFYANAYYFYRYKISFTTSGTATFYTDSSGDTYGFLSKSTGWDDVEGEPTSILASNDDGDDRNFKFTYDVTAGTTYYLWVRYYSTSTSGYIDLYIDPPEALPTVDAWSWTTSNGSASATLTRNAYNAVTGKTAVTNFSYLVWNDMVDKVKEICDALGYGWDSSYATYSNTRMTSSNKTLTAVKFNSLRYNIGKWYSTGISEVSPGDEVLGSYFTTLATRINSWIARDL